MFPIFLIGVCFFQLHEQLFKTEQNRLPESHNQEHEKVCVNNQTTDIEDVLIDFDKRGQLIIVHQHAKYEVNPVHYSDLSRFSFYPSQLKSIVDILGNEDTY